MHKSSSFIFCPIKSSCFSPLVQCHRFNNGGFPDSDRTRDEDNVLQPLSSWINFYLKGDWLTGLDPTGSSESDGENFHLTFRLKQLIDLDCRPGNSWSLKAIVKEFHKFQYCRLPIVCLCRLRIPIERQLWETRAAPRPTYLWSGTCPLQLRAYTQIPSCRRISSGLIAQVALLPFRGGGPLSPRGQHPILGPRIYLTYCRLCCEVWWWSWIHWVGIHEWQYEKSTRAKVK